MRREGPGRVPPHNREAEESLLGAMMLSPLAVDAAIDAGITAADFWSPTHQTMYEVMRDIHAASQPIDRTTVGEELRRIGQPELGASLMSAMAATPATSSAPRYAEIIAGHSLSRRIIQLAADLEDQGYEADDPSALLDDYESRLFALGDTKRARRTVRVEEALDDWYERLERRMESGDVSGLPTGYRDLDDLLLGLHPGQLVTVAGRTSMGKSAFTGSVATNVAMAGAGVLVVSVEMSLEELLDRYMAAASKVRITDVRRGQIDEPTHAKIVEGWERFRNVPLYVEDDPMATVLSVRASARRIAAKPHGLGLVIVDYLQLLSSIGRAENRQVEVAELSRGLKRLALELKVPVVAAAQLNRNLESRADKRPMLADLRESGSIENDSDVVCFLYRDEVYDQKTQDRGVCEVIVAKQRNGPQGVVRLAFDATRGTFGDMAKGRF